MPELPEVEHIARYLRPRLEGRRILGVPHGAARALEGLAGRRVRAVARRAKLLIIALDRGSLVFHLKLTGKLWVRGGDEPPARAARLVLDLEGGDALHFEDTRKLGWARLLDDDALARATAPLGPEPLEPSFTRALFEARLAERRGRLKPLLLDQTFVAGIGNIYADEILHAARLHPLRQAASLQPAERRALHREIVRVLARALADRTSDVPDQERVGQGGRAAAKRIATRKVFQRTGEPCPRCRATIVRLVVQGRGTHVCPSCQPAPAGRLARAGRGR